MAKKDYRFDLAGRSKETIHHVSFMTQYGFTAALLLFLLLLASCSRKQPATELVTFSLRGEVVRIDSTEGRLLVSHEEIPNYMPAMTMPFKLKDRRLLKRVSVGDSIGATLAVSRTESWLENIVVLRPGVGFTPLRAGEIERTQLNKEGDSVPDFLLLNQDGEPVSLSGFRGNMVVLTFLYSRCPLPDFCIRMSQQFAELQKLFKARGDVNTRLLSISFDPAHDRPAVLKEYGHNYGADFTLWQFLTDPDTMGTAVGVFANGFGLSYIPAEGLIDHNLRTAVIDQEGRLIRVLNGNEWKVEEVDALLAAPH